MIRSVIMIFCVFCVATVMAEALGLMFLWSRGQLSSDTLNEIHVALAGEGQFADEAGEEADHIQPSNEDIMNERTFRIIGLSSREEELDTLKSMVDASADDLSVQQEQFKNQQEEFEQRLADLNDSITSESADQGRGILLAMSPADAVAHLMQSETENNIVLLKGMSEKAIAKILQQFVKGDNDQQKRGREIFEAISRGEPLISSIEEMNEKLSPKVPTIQP